MRLPRLVLRRLLLSRTSAKRQPFFRTFVAKSTVYHQSRPQLPFLSIPTATASRQQFRYLTTERRAWLRHELLLSVRYTLYLWAIVACGGAAYFAVDQELLERKYPTPHEWTFWTRQRLRAAQWQRHRTDLATPDWVSVVSAAGDVVRRLEDPAVDGAGLVETSPPGRKPPGTRDIGAKGENWRRGYYEALMLYAAAAGRVDGWVVDRTRGVVFPPEVVLGPSNPRPRPIPAGAKSAPREEDCEVAYPPADSVYLKILATDGFTARQRMDAALALANFFECKGLHGPAVIMLEDAVALAQSDRSPHSPAALDVKTWVLRDKAGPVPENLLRSLTAYATFKARHGDVTSALPILISVLRARRALPKTTAQPDLPPGRQRYGDGVLAHVIGTVRTTLQPPPYPPPPPDGYGPPGRTAKELCEEAALHLHIGEIMYTAKAAGREDGLSWTRDAVDIAEQQLRSPEAADKDTRTTCRECLASGLENWARMVTRMAREEDSKTETVGQSSFGWLGFWGEGKREQPGRWTAEEQVVLERTRRAKDLLEDLEPPAKGLLSWFQA